MDKRYEVFCLADRFFYETPDRLSGDAAESAQDDRDSFPTALRPVPEGWRRTRSGDWLELRPVQGQFQPQGWKVHASACLDNADAVAEKVWDYCVARGIPFKFVPARTLLYLRNAKYAGRGTSGKFATIYPSGQEQLQVLLEELGELLAGEPGPYILTDLRWGNGPLYVRYGGFAPRFCLSPGGTLVPAVEDAHGRLVPDHKEPSFHVPEWVSLPSFLEPHLAARRAAKVTDLPYRIERALHFSNGGGVYGGTDERSGEAVVLKEARPHAGLAADGADAVTRLEREKAALERLEGLSVAPAVRDWFTLDGHRFLVMDHLPGQTLNAFFAQRHPLLTASPDPAAVREYTSWALRIHALVEEAVDAVHSRGLVFNDLHMFNIMVAPDERSVALLDFEAAAPAEDDPRQIVAHPGFIAPADRTGYEIDHYALACLRIALFVPMTMLLAVDRGKAAHLARVAAKQFPDVPEEFLSDAVATIEGTTGPRKARVRTQLPAEPADWPQARASMARAVLASATPSREDRLFPGDIAQFADGGGLGLAHGAAGVLYALAETGAGSCPEGEEWLLRHSESPPRGTPLGLYDGLLGAAFVLDRLGHSKNALALVERVLGEKWQHLGPTLNGGLAGVGLTLDRLGTTTGESALHAQAMRAAQLLADGLTPGAARGKPAGDDDPYRGRAGLLHGATGAALLFLRLHERTGDSGLLDLAATALRRDLSHCVPDSSGTLQVDEGSRVMPYLGAGSVGIGTVIDDYLEHRPAEQEFEAARAAILPAARMRYYAQPGLFQGRAGMLLHLCRTSSPDVRAADVAAQLDGLAWYGMTYEGGLAFPGDQMMRLSMDLATGTAGCLLAAGAAFAARNGEPPVGLPFLPPLPRSGPKTGPETGRTDAPPSL
ncbi:class III lanthionine synthetase LanKC [Streptomyces sp. WMMB 322]|uniref:class III lanthionine synthetase LanKC n=1 Tax=Streptomyces sp. WMMB 322 TaxID=1286821 RepID=UPI0006E2E9EF|nr:class III lanthionine synthetase LanKC [Streptomyces sp. WMMB 322]SCK40923.1 Serine/threonine protein kinase [Streptomyces sp. WMMB 322]